ncbi:hypothetical protein DFH09DRAFT_1216074 [Mycena vulgaris]|nr:hypothetical protein DFH09DRAFT_1216074 [Mycena vulgaris]
MEPVSALPTMDEDAFAELQRTSSEFMAFARIIGRVVTMSYPTHNGVKIVPKGIKNWARLRGLFIECYCAFGLGVDSPRSCQIVEGIDGDIKAFCHYDRPRCQFKLNLTRIHATSLLTSSFRDLPSLQSGNRPDMDTLAVAFTLRRFPSKELAPHFEGYFGEYIAGFPEGTHQLSGSILPRPLKYNVPHRRRHSSPYVRSQRAIPASNSRYLEIDDVYPGRREVQTVPARASARNAVAGPSRLRMEDFASVSRPAPFPLEEMSKDNKYLRLLMDGDGISEEAWTGLVEKCGSCNRVFTRKALKKHTKCCLGELTVF